jgi:DNA-binding MarR family transcriptional regulator
MQKINIDRHATAQINMLANTLMLKSSAAYTKKFGIGMMEWRVISVLSNNPNSSLQVISDILGLDKAAVSRTVKKLEEKKFISIGGDKTDKRVYVINLTNSGQQLYEVAADFAIDREKQLLENLTDDEKDQLFRLLKNLRAKVNEM